VTRRLNWARRNRRRGLKDSHRSALPLRTEWVAAMITLSSLIDAVYWALFALTLHLSDLRKRHVAEPGAPSARYAQRLLSFHASCSRDPCCDEGWPAMSLAFFQFGRHFRSWCTVGAALSAVRVASAQASGIFADKLCELVDIALRQGFGIRTIRHPVVGAVEHRSRVRGGSRQAQSTKMAAALARRETPSASCAARGSSSP
jgi:hypothetical protein